MKRIIICDNDEFDAILPFCLRNGLGIELQSFWNPVQPELYGPRIQYQLSKITEINFRSFHGPFGDLNGGSYDPMIREVTRDRMVLGYQTARKLEATHIVFHHGFVPHTSLPKNWVSRFVQFWKSFLDGKPANVYFHLENLLELSPEIMIETIDTISDPRVSACLDVGHAHCNSTTPVLNWIEKLGDRIRYVHIHDNDGTSDQHLAIGEGNIAFDDVCSALNQYSPDAIWALEMHPKGVKKSYDWLRQKGFVPESSR
jgi:sugar phosphate isomerase/epimerase